MSTRKYAIGYEKLKKKIIIIIIESRERLSGLAILSIENEMLEELEYKNLISQFASQKAKKIVKSLVAELAPIYVQSVWGV